MNLKNSIPDICENTKYIIDTYNKFQDNSNVIDTFKLYNEPYCIRKVSVEYDWGIPKLEEWPEQYFEIDYSYQHAYDTLEEAREFVRFLKRLRA